MSQNKNRTLLTETPSETPKTLITDALTDTKCKREQSLESAHKALESAFGPKLTEMVEQKLMSPTPPEALTEKDIQELIQEIDSELADNNPIVVDMKKRLNEAKDADLPQSDKEKMYRDIHRKFWAYAKSRPERVSSGKIPETETDRIVKNFLTNRNEPLIHWMSYEGSMIVCSLISIDNEGVAVVSMSQLPESDRNVINDILLRIIGKQYDSRSFLVKFDEYKNIEFRLDVDTRTDPVRFTLGNRVASIPPNESSRYGKVDVKVERKGKDVVIGDRIVIEKSKMQNLAQTGDHSSNGGYNKEREKKQKVSGRNAYEIRADVLEMALDWVKENKKSGTDENDVIEVAEAFYKFVEHK